MELIYYIVELVVSIAKGAMRSNEEKKGPLVLSRYWAKAISVAQNTTFTLVKTWFVQQIVPHRFLNGFVSGTDQKRSFLCTDREHGFILEV